MLGLDKVCDISLSVNAADDESAAGSAHVLLRDERELKLLQCVHLHSAHEKIPIDDRYLERGIDELVKRLKQIVVEDEIRLVINCIGVAVPLVKHGTVGPSVAVN